MSNPVVKYYRCNANIKFKRWYLENPGSSKNGKLHRLDGPAEICYYKNGTSLVGSATIKFESWYQNGLSHRLDGPANIGYYENGNKKYETWYRQDPGPPQNGSVHRLDGPAHIGYYEDGNKDYEQWFKNGSLHRLDGPANIEYYENGNIKKKYYFQNKEYTENKFYRTVYLVKKFIRKIKQRQREKYNKLLQTTQIQNQGKDILDILLKFVY
jgi:antitoxin component YwqK of YwqJK toxin-antitoxin module